MPILCTTRSSDDPQLGRKPAVEHLRLTHLGKQMEAAGNLLLDILQPVLDGKSFLDVMTQKIQQQDNPLLGYPLSRWLKDADDIVVGGRLSTACYVQDAVPATMYLALKYHQDVERGLIANTNLGGDNAGRGAVNDHRAFPESWIGGLTHPPTNLIPK